MLPPETCELDVRHHHSIRPDALKADQSVSSVRSNVTTTSSVTDVPATATDSPTADIIQFTGASSPGAVGPFAMGARPGRVQRLSSSKIRRAPRAGSPKDLTAAEINECMLILLVICSVMAVAALCVAMVVTVE